MILSLASERNISLAQKSSLGSRGNVDIENGKQTQSCMHYISPAHRDTPQIRAVPANLISSDIPKSPQRPPGRARIAFHPLARASTLPRPRKRLSAPFKSIFVFRPCFEATLCPNYRPRSSSHPKCKQKGAPHGAPFLTSSQLLHNSDHHTIIDTILSHNEIHNVITQ